VLDGTLEGEGQLSDVGGSSHRVSPKKKQGAKPCQTSLIDNTLVLGTLLSGGQRSSLDVVDVRQLGRCL